MRFLSREEGMGNKLSKPTWFLIFEYQVAKAYILRDSSENVYTSSDSWIQVVEFGEWEIPLFSLPQTKIIIHTAFSSPLALYKS